MQQTVTEPSNINIAARQVSSEGYLTDRPIQNSFGSTMELSNAARDWLSKQCMSADHKFMMATNQELLSFERRVDKQDVSFAPGPR